MTPTWHQIDQFEHKFQQVVTSYIYIYIYILINWPFLPKTRKNNSYP